MMNLLSKVATKATLKIVGIAVTSAAAGFIAGVLTSKSKLEEVKKDFWTNVRIPGDVNDQNIEPEKVKWRTGERG
jgi:predicted neutral ceramidase superfamily lipid hydrolase